MVVFDDDLTECPNCGRDDALMSPFEPSLEDSTWVQIISLLSQLDVEAKEDKNIRSITIDRDSPPRIQLRYEAFVTMFKGTVAKSERNGVWEHLEVAHCGALFCSCREITTESVIREVML
jgi:hypothetical protein